MKSLKEFKRMKCRKRKRRRERWQHYKPIWLLRAEQEVDFRRGVQQSYVEVPAGQATKRFVMSSPSSWSPSPSLTSSVLTFCYSTSSAVPSSSQVSALHSTHLNNLSKNPLCHLEKKSTRLQYVAWLDIVCWFALAVVQHSSEIINIKNLLC